MAPSWRSGSGQVEVGGERLVRPRPHDTKLCICHDARDSVSSPALEVASKEARGCRVKSLATCWRMHADLHYWWVDLPPIGGHHYDESDYDFVVPYRICCSILSQLNHHQITSSSNLFLIHYQWLDALKSLFPRDPPATYLEAGSQLTASPSYIFQTRPFVLQPSPGRPA